MQTLSLFSTFLFVLTTGITVYIFWRAASRSRIVLLVILCWLVLQACISAAGFYKVVDTIPPRFLALIGPPLLFILILFGTNKGRAFIDKLDTGLLTFLHIVRIPVEITLYTLLLQKLVPSIMTFEGHNLDIISGITAPIIYYYGYIKNKISPKFIIAWNFICIGLLVNIVALAVLSAPFTFQRIAFDQPNKAVLIFPYIWLPCFVVPVVLFSHLVSLRQLLIKPRMTFGQTVLG